MLSRKQYLKDDMRTQIVQLINELTENKNLLHKLTNAQTDGLIDEYSIAEMHCIEAIGRIEAPNVTKLANNLNLTKGAITKIIKKLSFKKAVSCYEKENNKKEKYYKLTEIGESVNEKHRKIHDTLCVSEIKFLECYGAESLMVVEGFLKNYNRYLADKIRSMK